MNLGAQKKGRGFEDKKKKNWIRINSIQFKIRKSQKIRSRTRKKNLGPKLKNTDPEQAYKIDPGAKKNIADSD